MTPSEIYNRVSDFSDVSATIICDLHSACSPRRGRSYSCVNPGSTISVMDFDEVKTLLDKAQGQESRKSVDALAVSPSKTYLCFIELKSWELQLSYNGSEKKIRRQAAKYSSDLPVKLSDSMQICREITDNPETFDGCRILYILVTDISVADDGIRAFNSDLTALAGTSSNLKDLCNSLSQRVMDGITTVETRYWECRNFDTNLSSL